MNTDDHHQRSALLKDTVAFLTTMGVCAYFMSATANLTRSVNPCPAEVAILALPSPPAPPVLLPEPVPAPAPMAGASGEKVQDHRHVISAAPDDSLPEEPMPFHRIITQVAGRYEVDPNLIRAIIFAESGYNPKAKSKRGARGLMQLMPSTAKALGVQDAYDPKENIEGGVRYFRSLLDRFDGDVQLALAAYNAGSRHVRNYDGVPPFKATRHYIKKVLKFHQLFKMERNAGTRRLA